MKAREVGLTNQRDRVQGSFKIRLWLKRINQ